MYLRRERISRVAIGPSVLEIQKQMGSDVERTRGQQTDCSAETLSRALEHPSPLPSPQDAAGKPTHVAATSVREYTRTGDGTSAEPTPT